MAISAAKPMTIGALAATCGVGVETIRYYQRSGLLEEPPRGAGYRHYGPAHVERLNFIRRAQRIGFSLAEVAELLRLNDSRDHAIARDIARDKIADIEARIGQLQAMAKALSHLVCACEQGDGAMPCPIIRLALENA
jgi:MerR family mercuric resistance operon transcriptional regulator